MTPPFPTQRPSDLAREDLYFDLDGTSRALDTLLDCVERANALSSPGNPFADARSTSANPFAGNDSRAGSNDQDIVEGLLLRSEEHTSELQSLMRISYAVFCLKKKTKQRIKHITHSIKSKKT